MKNGLYNGDAWNFIRLVSSHYEKLEVGVEHGVRVDWDLPQIRGVIQLVKLSFLSFPFNFLKKCLTN